MEDMKASVTNQQVATDLGVSHATISRIRSGDRVPSVELMDTIARVTRWKINRQVGARLAGKYADEFESMLARHYSHTTEFNPPEANNYGVG